MRSSRDERLIRAGGRGSARIKYSTLIVAVLVTAIAFAAPPSAGAHVSGASQAEPILGVLQIDPREGEPGDVVAAELDPDLIAESCTLSLEDFVAQATEFDSGPFTTAFEELIVRRGWSTTPPDFTTDPEAAAFLAIRGILFGVRFFPDIPETVFDQTFALTFADIGTQQPVGDLSSFDPLNGTGTVTVPEVAPGSWAVAATCLEWNMAFDIETLEAAMEVGAAWLEANAEQPYPETLADPAFQALATQIGPTVLGEGVLVPGATWVEIFCVTAGGVCQTTPPPTAPGPGGTVNPPIAQPAEAVQGDPNFTG